MTNTGSMRLKYSRVEVAPSRFSDPDGYAAWCLRAELWAWVNNVEA